MNAGRCFVDTSAFIAVADRSDQRHADAVRLAKLIDSRRMRQFTTNYVLAELYTRLRRTTGLAGAIRVAELIRRQINAGQLTLAYADEALDATAWQIFEKYHDQDFSYVDCTSFAWLQSNPKIAVFAFDRHFQWMGFDLLST